MNVLLVGASGLVGNQCLQQLLQDKRVQHIIVLVRKPMIESHRKLHTIVTDFTNVEQINLPLSIHALICTLGTTIKKAGSEENFYKVDHDYPVAAARLGLKFGASQFALTSALGAEKASRIFYNRVKGMVEASISNLPFKKITIVRPSLLLGDRKEFRLGERLAQVLTPIVPLSYKPIHANAVAHALVQSLFEDFSGVRIIESKEIHKLYGIA